MVQKFSGTFAECAFPVDDLSDEALMLKVQAGQTQMLELLVRRYERPLFGLALRVLGDRAGAEDAFQETFLRVFQKRASYRAGAPFRPWLYQICLNLCRDLLRSRSRRPTVELEFHPPDPQGGPEQQTQKTLLAEKVARVVGELPDKQREVFLLHFYQHLPYPEIAEVLDIPVGTVKSRMFHASKFLAEHLKGER